jgi:hypothetical protein
MAYKIKPLQARKAKALGVTIKPSTNPKKKIDVFKRGQLVARIGATGYKDYATYLEEEKKGKASKGTAETRKRLYQLRHSGEQKRKGTAGYYAWKILW